MAALRERMVFDAERGEYRDGTIRYMMIRPDALMGLFAELPPDAAAAALAALGRSVRRFGGRSAATYRDSAPDGLLEVIAATAPQLGWGVWTLRREGEGLTLDVQNSPFAAGAGAQPAPVCAAIGGMMAAVGGMVLSGEAVAVETDCAASGAACCRFAVSRAAPPAAAGAAPRR